jgi:hypothetical protein
MAPGENDKKEPRDFVFLDLAQDLFPDKDRDNAGETLGLFYYDLLLRPRFHWLPLQTLALGVYGDHDWHEGMRTFDAEVQVGRIAGITWTGDYRTDSLVNGAVGLTASTRSWTGGTSTRAASATSSSTSGSTTRSACAATTTTGRSCSRQTTTLHGRDDVPARVRAALRRHEPQHSRPLLGQRRAGNFATSY